MKFSATTPVLEAFPYDPLSPFPAEFADLLQSSQVIVDKGGKTILMVLTATGPVQCNAGDYVLRAENNGFSVCDRARFESLVKLAS